MVELSDLKLAVRSDVFITLVRSVFVREHSRIGQIKAFSVKESMIPSERERWKSARPLSYLVFGQSRTNQPTNQPSKEYELVLSEARETSASSILTESREREKQIPVGRKNTRRSSTSGNRQVVFYETMFCFQQGGISIKRSPSSIKANRPHLDLIWRSLASTAFRMNSVFVLSRSSSSSLAFRCFARATSPPSSLATFTQVLRRRGRYQAGRRRRCSWWWWWWFTFVENNMYHKGSKKDCLL